MFRKLALGDEAQGTALCHQRAELGAVPARGEDHALAGPSLATSSTRRHLEAVEVGKLHVEEEEIGVKLGREPQSLRAVFRFTHHFEPLGLEQDVRGSPKTRMVVHDQRLLRIPHVIVPEPQSRSHTASHTICSLLTRRGAS